MSYMTKIHIPTPLRQYAGKQATVEVHGDPHHCVVPGLLASGWPIVPRLATIFMPRCERTPVMLTC
jgi:hypothetical protein